MCFFDLSMLLLIADGSARNTGLYASSRTLFALVQLYGNSYMRAIFGRTNNGNTPMAAILFSSLFGFLALLVLVNTSFDQVRPSKTIRAAQIPEGDWLHRSQCKFFPHFLRVVLDVCMQASVGHISSSCQGMYICRSSLKLPRIKLTTAAVWSALTCATSLSIESNTTGHIGNRHARYLA